MEAALPRIAEMQSSVWRGRALRRRRRRLVSGLVAEYTRHSTLHGLRYTTDRRLHTFEKLFWVATFAGSAALCGHFIGNVHHKWATSPVIVTVGARPVSAGALPFPALTICPQIKVKATAYNFTARTAALNASAAPAALDEYEDMAALCRYPPSLFPYALAPAVARRRTNTTLVDRLLRVAPDLEETVFSCRVADAPYDYISDIFVPTFTSEGLCFTYNGMSSEELYRGNVSLNRFAVKTSRGWSPAAGYGDTRDPRPYPARGQLNADRPDLQLVLSNEIAVEDPLCNGLRSGYKIYLGHPADEPQASLYYYAALDGQITSLAVKATIFTAPASLQNYAIEQRQCYFPDDKYLRYFKVYSFANCQSECLSNVTYSVCGCVEYYMPHDPAEGRRVCALRDQTCVSGAHQAMVQRELQAEREGGAAGGACRCLAACDSVEYDAEVLKTEYKFSQYVESVFRTSYGESAGIANSTRTSALEVYFKRSQFVAMHRAELFGLTDFIANVGGLLGVFLGFSFLSAVELLYFMFIRVGFTLRADAADAKTA